MSTESARKAAEELWDLQYGLKDDWIEKAVPIISAACQTVAPPPGDSIRTIATELLDTMETCHICKGALILQEHLVHCKDCSVDCENHDEPECTTIQTLHQRLRRALRESGAAPAVSAPPQLEAAAKEIARKGYRWLGHGEETATKNILEIIKQFISGAAVSTPRCPTDDEIARVIYERAFDCRWADTQGIERDLWLEVAKELAQFFPPAPSPPQWISVKERMPKESDTVLLVVNGLRVEGSYVEMGWLRAECDEDNCWQSVETAPQDEPIYFREDQVTHWQPLPYPPAPPPAQGESK